MIERFNFEKFSLSPRERRLYASDGRLIPLSARAFDTLLLLVQRTNELIDRQTFMRTLWPDLTVEPNNLDQNISIVRRALGREARRASLHRDCARPRVPIRTHGDPCGQRRD